jgi:hypothetical protein
MRSFEINLILPPPIPGFSGISTYVVCTHYLGLSVLPGRSSVIWREFKNPATTESNTSYIGTSNSMRSCETWSWDLMRPCWSHRFSWEFSSHKGHSQENLNLTKTHETRLRPNSTNRFLQVTLAAHGLEELFFQLWFCVSFWFWWEIGFGFTYLCT